MYTLLKKDIKMKNNMILTVSAAVLLLAGVSHVCAQPMQLQPAPAPQVSTPQMDERVTLGDSGTMFARRLAAKDQDVSAANVAAIAPAAGTPAPKTIVQPPLTAPVTATPPAVVAPAPSAAPAAAPMAKMVGGAQMLSSRTIMDNITGARDFSTLVKALNTSGVNAALSGPGPFTVFAPTNKAFAKLPKASLNELMKPESKDKLTKLLNYHVIAGTHDAASILADIKAAGGKTTYQSVAGSELTASLVKGVVTLTDENGNVSHVTTADVYQSNGIVHVVDTVVIPK